MARSFRFYEKKRGHRRTGSRQFGRVGELIFFAALLLIGLVGALVVVCTVVVPEWRANHEFVSHTCRVLGTRVAERDDDDGKLYRPEVQIEYEVAGVPYRTWAYDVAGAYSAGREANQEKLDVFRIDPKKPIEYPCWYDPLDPSVVVVVRGYSWWLWPLLLVWGAFLLTGAGGLVYTWLHWGKSAERRALIERRLRDRELFRLNGSAPREFPFVPSGDEITNSPGTHLKFRLPIGTSPGWLMFSALAISIVWNGLVGVWAVIAVNQFLSGESGWWVLALFLLPFAAVGIGLLAWFIRQLLITTGIGPTHVEIADHPLVVGCEYRLFIAQPGRLKFHRLAVYLVCEEEATYRQGTNSRTESCEVFRQEVFCRDAFEVRAGEPLEAHCELVVPDGAMHSFKAKNNAISWKIVVQGDIAGWPDYVRAFPVVVRPASRSPS